MTRGKVISRLIEQQPQILERELETRSRCILATSVGIDVLAAFGIDASPLSVKVDLVNAAWVKWVQDGKPGGITNLERCGGWALSAGYEPGTSGAPYKPPRPGHWDGHLVVELTGQKAVIDLDMQQMNRPEKNIVLPSAVLLHLPDDDSGWEFNTPDGGKMLIQARREDDSFKGARDWWDKAKRKPMVDEVIRAIRKGR